ncbi:aldehyde dehydrogenase family protein [Sphingobium sp. V4]|uniref:aldehyde dehydrogenase family protein n=1 Tax=Sphingobium sp. V4 TaxID=3038927 RepID=UPI002557D18A|nr:aldehyde dehydrogenase family protein [Sphingobium sp. V4]WIW89498.1 aldehyde dehydrogenase family protein [Sphingobium sp. V4]
MVILTRDYSALPKGELLIGGRRVSTGSLGEVTHIDPTTGATTGTFPVAGKDEVDAAVGAARAAFPAWRKLPAVERRAMLLRLADLIEENGERLAQTGAIENGGPIAFNRRGCVAGPAGWFRYYAGWCDKIEGRQIPIGEGTLDYTIVEPMGVIALLLAFNGPMSFLGFKAAPALAAGNTLVIKPSELASWNVLLFGELCEAAGIPAGVINIVTGDGRTGALLAGQPGIAKISFTGGGGTARAILEIAAKNLTPTAMELGGKSATILFDDCDLNTAVPTAVLPALSLMSGQVCLSGTRLLVQRGIYDEVLERAVAATGSIRQGDPMLDDTQMGPVISKFHQQRVLDVVTAAGARGDGRKLVGGTPLEGEFAAGAFVTPTLFADVAPHSELAQKEIFGPVLSIIPFEDEDEAVAIANNTNLGLAGYVFTENFGRAHRMASRVETGFLSINTYGLLHPAVPFGGIKESGFGREGGHEGLLEFVHVKNVQAKIN